MDENEQPTEEFENLDKTTLDETGEIISKKPVPIKAQLAVLAVMLFVVFSIGIIPKVFPDKQEVAAENSEESLVKASSEEIDPEFQEKLIDIKIVGEAAFVWDIKGQRVLYEKNADKELPLASITKLMTALLAYEIIENDKTVGITDKAVLQEGDSGLSSGEYFNFKDLLGLTLMSSSNDGAYALATAAGSLLSSNDPTENFVKAMNIRAEELGLNKTYFHNPTGLDISEEAGGAFGSARDMAFLLEYIVKFTPEILDATTENTDLIYNTNGQFHQSENTNPLVDEIPGLIGSKTGYTTLAGGNLAIAFDAGLNRPVIVIVLGSTRSDRFYDVLKLSKAAQSELTETNQ